MTQWYIVNPDDEVTPEEIEEVVEEVLDGVNLLVLYNNAKA